MVSYFILFLGIQPEFGSSSAVKVSVSVVDEKEVGVIGMEGDRRTGFHQVACFVFHAIESCPGIMYVVFIHQVRVSLHVSPRAYPCNME